MTYSIEVQIPFKTSNQILQRKTRGWIPLTLHFPQKTKEILLLLELDTRESTWHVEIT